MPTCGIVSCEDAAQDTEQAISVSHTGIEAQLKAQRVVEEDSMRVDEPAMHNTGDIDGDVVRPSIQADRGCGHSSASCGMNEWAPAGVHVGEVCTATPAPHESDGGIRVSVVEQTEPQEKDGAKSQSKAQKGSRKKYVRLPNARARRRAREESRIHAFGVRHANGGYVCLRQEEVTSIDEARHEVQLFDAWTTIAKNIRDASKWASQPLSSRDEAEAKAQEGGTSIDNASGDEHAKQTRVQWKSSAPSFTPPATAAHTDADNGRTHATAADVATPLIPKSTQYAELSQLQLRDLLHHRQVSHVRQAPRKAKTKMDEFNKCQHGRMQLDLSGTTAKQIQADLRAQLVQDLKEGSDEAAFVCKQLGIDSVPRADQLELMIAAMPGLTKLVFEGPVAKSGLNISEWKAGHATHCTKGCTASDIDEECYFRVVHHFLLRGYEPELDPGQTWDQFKKKYPAYVDVWRADETRCRKAWEKWKQNSADLLSEPVDKEPEFAVPILPATRSKHRWRFLKHGIPYKVRLCLDLKASKVNGATSDWRFRYRGLDDIAANLKRGDWLASVDISRFYLRLPAGPNLRRVQWVQDPESYAYTAKLNNRSKRRTWRQLQAIGFGLKTAPAWASVVSAELVRILKAAGVRVVGCFIDDLLIAGSTRQECQKALDTAIDTMRRLGIPANEKTVLPQSPNDGIVFLGVHIRTSDMRFTISEEHRQYAVDRVKSALEDGLATKGDLASIAGVLNWISFVFIPGKPRRQCIYDAARLGTSGKKSDSVKIEGALQRQLQWWLHSLQSDQWVGTRIWDADATPAQVLVQSDASGADGWGACVGGFHFVGPWPTYLEDASMLFKEMVPVAFTISLFAAKLPETIFGVAVDNTGVAFAVNKMSCRDKLTLRMLQQLTSDLERGGHTVLGAHIRRHRNKHTDAMSHPLTRSLWKHIVTDQRHSSRLCDGSYWLFPFVAQQLSTAECVSGCFRMRKSLFAKLSDEASNVDA